MRYALCLLDRNWLGITDAQRSRYESLPRARGYEFAWWALGPAAALVAWDDPWGDPLIAREGDWVAVGTVRLDNRQEIQRRVTTADAPGTDLQLLLRLVKTSGTACIRDILGDFAFVAWNQRSHTIVAATDALGVKKLFHTTTGDLHGFSTRAEALATENSYEERYLAEFIALCDATPGLTPFKGVSRLPAGAIAASHNGPLIINQYWSPDEFDCIRLNPAQQREAPERLRDLLFQSVLQRSTPGNTVWAQLSGGLDSSSIVCAAHALTERGLLAHGLAGTVSFVDWQGTDADEREYSRAVATSCGVRNEEIVDPPLWREDDTVALPNLDEPRDSLAFHPRERRLCDVVHRNGGRILLTGFGGDELFTGTPVFFADWVARGRLWPAARELSRWAVKGRVSFWEIAYGNALLPLIPRALRRPSSFNDGKLLPWIPPRAAQTYGLNGRSYAVSGNGGRIGHKYHDVVISRVRGLSAQLDAGAIGDRLDVRYPFLARPLVEFALRLPAELCAQPQARKWVLREAMRGILPESVRTRVGKGGPTDALVRSLSVDRTILEPLLEDPLLADLGLVDAKQLKAAFSQAPLTPNDDRVVAADVQKTLMVEAWLRSRAGRWPPVPSS